MYICMCMYNHVCMYVCVYITYTYFYKGQGSGQHPPLPLMHIPSPPVGGCGWVGGCPPPVSGGGPWAGACGIHRRRSRKSMRSCCIYASVYVCMHPCMITQFKQKSLWFVLLVLIVVYLCLTFFLLGNLAVPGRVSRGFT